MDDPWGFDEAAVRHILQPLPPRLAALSRLTEAVPLSADEDFRWPSALELPEVRSLAAQGWHAPEEFPPVFPALWPREHRCWLPDRLPRVAISWHGLRGSVVPEVLWRRPYQDPAASDAEEAGLPSPPPGRIWLLRSPIEWLGFRALVSLIRRRAVEVAGEDDGSEVAGIAAAAVELLSWSEEVLELWLSDVDRDVVGQWRARGRQGDAASPWVVAGLTPGDIDRLAMLQVNEQQALDWAESLYKRGGDVVEAVGMWRRLGLPADPPEELHRFSAWSEVTLQQWLRAGFDVEEMRNCSGMPLDRAKQWRQAGYSLAETFNLYCADARLTLEEARAFADEGFDVLGQMVWVECGFSAVEAKAWFAIGITPAQARVWRARGMGPQDVPEGESIPPGYEPVGWFGIPPGRPGFEPYVEDPPGTRGRGRS